MNRILLTLILGLGTLLVVSRMTAAAENEPGGVATRPDSAPPKFQSGGAPAQARQTVAVAPPAPAVAAPSQTPLLNQLARLETRRRLGFSIRHTYLDSLFVGPDSTIRRWSPPGNSLRVWVTTPASGLPGRLDQVVWNALAAWHRPDLGIRFVRAGDSLAADIVIGWVERFETSPTGGGNQTGLTSLLADGRGELRLARVQLALGDGQGHQLTDREMEAVALHEVGHALGLPHSGDRADIMFPTVLTTQLSARDRSSLTLLYSLPPGSLREPGLP